MNSAVMFSRASDEWATPDDLFACLDAEFKFQLDAAATRGNTKCAFWIDEETDAINVGQWAEPSMPVWLNPPYSRCREFMAKAAGQAALGITVVCLVPARTDTRWFHDHVWDATTHQPREHVDVRFLKGRLKFGNATAGAPFPSMIVIFRGH